MASWKDVSEGGCVLENQRAFHTDHGLWCDALLGLTEVAEEAGCDG